MKTMNDLIISDAAASELSGNVESQHSQHKTKGQPKVTQAAAIAALANGENVALFHTPDRESYADIIVNDHRETWPVRSKQFTWWLRKAYYDETGGAPGGESLSSALDLVEA